MLAKQDQPPMVKEEIQEDVQHVVDLCNMSKHIELKHKVKNINRKADFYEMINESMLNEIEKKVMIMHYVENKPFDYIADELGYSVQGITKMHKRILNKLESLL